MWRRPREGTKPGKKLDLAVNPIRSGDFRAGAGAREAKVRTDVPAGGWRLLPADQAVYDRGYPGAFRGVSCETIRYWVVAVQATRKTLVSCGRRPSGQGRQ